MSEMKSLFREYYSAEWCNIMEMRIPGYTEMAYQVFCTAHTVGYTQGQIELLKENINGKGS